MNAIIEGKTELKFLLEKIYLSIKDPSSNIVSKTEITYFFQNEEDINNYVDSIKYLKSNSAIEKSIEISSGQDEIEDGYDDHDVMIYFVKEVFYFRPKTFIKFLVETSRIPIYRLEFDERYDRLILSDYLGNKYTLKTLQYDGLNYHFVRYLFETSAKKTIIRKEALRKQDIGEKNFKQLNSKKRSMQSILDNIFSYDKKVCRELIKAFFTKISADSVCFSNMTTRNELKRLKLNENNIIDFLNELK